ncbi:MAG: uracil-DNA glycosylase [Acidobacteria bacterium]|nr:uracil-DNA glycosylase [Acidobacteriota bacterium]
MGVRELRATPGAAPAQAKPQMSAKPERSEAPRAPVSKAAGPASTSPRATALTELREKEIGECRRCRLCEQRTNIVFGVGSPEARLMFVGEGPGHDEDLQGIPFVGRAGQLLTDIITAMKFTRDQVYIANVVKCRPPQNRTPEPDEIGACLGFLEKQIEIIAPSAIVCLGAVAVAALLGATGGITKIRGTFREFRGIPVMPTFHPAYLLRSPDKKKDVWRDMQQVMALLAGESDRG